VRPAFLVPADLHVSNTPPPWERHWRPMRTTPKTIARPGRRGQKAIRFRPVISGKC